MIRHLISEGVPSLRSLIQTLEGYSGGSADILQVAQDLYRQLPLAEKFDPTTHVYYAAKNLSDAEWESEDEIEVRDAYLMNALAHLYVALSEQDDGDR